MAIIFSYADRQPRLKDKRLVKQFIKDLLLGEGQELDALNYVFCSDEYLLGINREFLNHDFYTDIITFDLRDNHREAVNGEIYISIERVEENRINHDSSFREELLRVLFHGALHLCGYKDKTKREILVMRQKEDHYLRLFNALTK